MTIKTLREKLRDYEDKMEATAQVRICCMGVWGRAAGTLFQGEYIDGAVPLQRSEVMYEFLLNLA